MADFYHRRPEPAEGWPRRDTPEALLRASNEAHDNVRKLVRMNDRLRGDQFELIELLRRERKWRKLLLAGLVAAWGTLLWVVSNFAPYVVKGMGR